MPQITLNIDINDSELQTLQAVAHFRQTEPLEMLGAVLKQGLQQLAPEAKVDLAGLTLQERQTRRFALLQGSSGIWQGEPGKAEGRAAVSQALRCE
ncbi:MAG: hypothetical protein ABW202_11020 [Duganella sp.]